MILGSTSLRPRFTMPKRKGEWTQEKFDQYLKEGRGQGVGGKYVP